MEGPTIELDEEMTLGTFRKLSSILLLTCFISLSQAAGVNSDIHLTGKLVDVHPQAGCGIFFLGSPVTYQVLKGPANLDGKQITAVVPCIEMPLIKGDVRVFVVGDVHDLRVSRKKPYQLLSTELLDQSWFYLKAASFQELRSK